MGLFGPAALEIGNLSSCYVPKGTGVPTQFFWPAFPPLSSYSLNTRIWYVFLISVRIEFTCNPPVGRATQPSVRLAMRFFPAGRIRRAGTFPTKLDIRNFVRLSPESRSGEISSSSFLPPIDLPSLHSLLTPREHRSVSPFKLNFFCFFSCLLLRSINLCIK